MLCSRDTHGSFHAERYRTSLRQPGLRQGLVDAMAWVEREQRDPRDTGDGVKDCTWLWKGVLVVHALENQPGDDLPTPYYQAVKKCRLYEGTHAPPSQGSVHLFECCDMCHLTSEHWQALGYKTKALDRALAAKTARERAVYAVRMDYHPDGEGHSGLPPMPSGYTDTAHYSRTGEIRQLPFPITPPWNG